MTDTEKFPSPVYARTVLAPLFEGYQRHHRDRLVAIHFAHGIMLRERGWLTPEQTSALFGALRDSITATDGVALDYTGEHEDFFFWLESQLAARLGPDLAGRLHMGRSRNDIDHTIYRMNLREHLLATLARTDRLIGTLLDRAEENAAVLVVAYTHGQPAQPTTFGHYLGALIEALLRDADRLLHAYATVDLCPLGAAAITTSGFGLDRARTAELLGFSAVLENSYGCIAGIDHIAETYMAMKVMLIGLGRFVQDLNVWTGFEAGHLHVPDAFVQISSIMPQKRNPVPIEHLRLLCSLAAGRADAILLALHNTPFADMNDSEAPVQEAGYEVFDTAARALDLLDALMAKVTVNETRTRAHIDESCITITELADTLVRLEGISFRQAHEIAAQLARRMLADGMTLATVPLEVFRAAFAEASGRAPGIDEARFRSICTPEHFVSVRTMFGGPAPEPLARSFGRYRTALAGSRDIAAKHRRRIDAAAARRDALL
jgi:argininosuccinate lyase